MIEQQTVSSPCATVYQYWIEVGGELGAAETIGCEVVAQVQQKNHHDSNFFKGKKMDFFGTPNSEISDPPSRNRVSPTLSCAHLEAIWRSSDFLNAPPTPQTPTFHKQRFDLEGGIRTAFAGVFEPAVGGWGKVGVPLKHFHSKT